MENYELLKIETIDKLSIPSKKITYGYAIVKLSSEFQNFCIKICKNKESEIEYKVVFNGEIINVKSVEYLLEVTEKFLEFIKKNNIPLLIKIPCFTKFKDFEFNFINLLNTLNTGVTFVFPENNYYISQFTTIEPFNKTIEDDIYLKLLTKEINSSSLSSESLDFINNMIKLIKKELFNIEEHSDE